MQKKVNVRFLTVTAILAAVSAVLMYLDFSVPLVPGFLKMDLSEFPALLAAFSMGPLSGVAVCFLKNLVHLTATSTAGAGELANFLLGVCFVLPAGLLYKKHRTFKGALAAAGVGTVTMALLSLPVNLLISYPAYTLFYGLSTEAILGMYQVFLPWVKELWQALLIFNVPFTLVKGLLSVVITFLLYKRLSPIIKGGKGKEQ